MRFKQKRKNNHLTLKLVRKLDSLAAPDFEEEVRGVVEDFDDLVFYFDELRYISSPGLRVLLATQKLMKDKGEIKIINVSYNN